MADLLGGVGLLVAFRLRVRATWWLTGGLKVLMDQNCGSSWNSTISYDIMEYHGLAQHATAKLKPIETPEAGAFWRLRHFTEPHVPRSTLGCFSRFSEKQQFIARYQS